MGAVQNERRLSCMQPSRSHAPPLLASRNNNTIVAEDAAQLTSLRGVESVLHDDGVLITKATNTYWLKCCDCKLPMLTDDLGSFQVSAMDGPLKDGVLREVSFSLPCSQCTKKRTTSERLGVKKFAALFPGGRESHACRTVLAAVMLHAQAKLDVRRRV